LIALCFVILISCEPPKSEKIAASEDQIADSTISSNESYTTGVEYAIQGNFPKAMEEFEKAIKDDLFSIQAKNCLITIKDVNEQKIKKETAINFFKAVSFNNKGQLDQAISYFTKAIKINPDYVEAYFNRGNVYDSKGQYDQAIKDFNKILEINPNYVKAYQDLGIAHTEKGQYDQAISYFTKAIKINPNYAEAYFSRGITYSRKGNYNQAVTDFTKTLEITPKDADVYASRGYIYLFNLKNEDKACADFRKACELGSCQNYNHAKQHGYCQ
jgi:tetratricopeptide (TPR) repeat protein